MYDDDGEDDTRYKVVVNHEEQYSIWPADRDNPLGWRDAEKAGPKAECLAHIKEVWTDMRPLSLRKAMEEAARKRAQSLPDQGPSMDRVAAVAKGPGPDDLVRRLSEGDQPVEAGLRPSRTARVLKDCIDRGYVHIKFTQTRGGTELGVRLDPESSDTSEADFENQAGRVHLEGTLTLNHVRVRCVADIDLRSLAGTGRLVPFSS